MLNIFYGDMKEAVYNTAGYFKYDYEDEWIVDPFVKKMILDVDKSTVMGQRGNRQSRFWKDTAGWIIGWGKRL